MIPSRQCQLYIINGTQKKLGRFLGTSKTFRPLPSISFLAERRMRWASQEKCFVKQVESRLLLGNKWNGNMYTTSLSHALIPIMKSKMNVISFIPVFMPYAPINWH
jgi:hypothetical protein